MQLIELWETYLLQLDSDEDGPPLMPVDCIRRGAETLKVWPPEHEDSDEQDESQNPDHPPAEADHNPDVAESAQLAPGDKED